MSALSPSPTRRTLLATAAAAAALCLIPTTMLAATQDTSIRPFGARIAQKEIDELRRRVAATSRPGSSRNFSRLN